MNLFKILDPPTVYIKSPLTIAIEYKSGAKTNLLGDIVYLFTENLE